MKKLKTKHIVTFSAAVLILTFILIGFLSQAETSNTQSDWTIERNTWIKHYRSDGVDITCVYFRPRGAGIKEMECFPRPAEDTENE